MKPKDYLKNKLKQRWPTYIMNINDDVFNTSQRRVLLCFITTPLRLDLRRSIFHPNILRANQMVTSLIKAGYIVDVCDCTDTVYFDLFKTIDYYAIIGFGPLYEALCEAMPNAKKVFYLTENDPLVFQHKYEQRIKYLKERHPEIKRVPANKRVQYYTNRQIELSTDAIIMTNECNSSRVRQLIPGYKTIKVNGMLNPNYSFSYGNIGERRKNFLWFGSIGALAKGLDILIDVFRELPQYNMNVYGVFPDEVSFLKRLKLPVNVRLRGKVSVQSDEFLEVVNNNLFIISASCVEGMQSGVATCLRHGMIPLLTNECGYEKNPSIFLFEDYKVETIREAILEVEQKSDGELEIISRNAYEYGNREHTLESFVTKFTSIVNEL